MSYRDRTEAIVVLGAGLAGCSAALELARLGHEVIVIDRTPRPMLAASRYNEGKLHLGYIYAADPVQETHALLSEGSLRFLDQIAGLTGFAPGAQVCSGTFTYVVPEDSTHAPDALWAHVRKVDATVAAQSARLGLPPLPPSRIADMDRLRGVYSDRISAAFQVPEIAIEPGRMADTVSAALYAAPRVSFRGGCTVSAAEPRGDGRFTIALETGAGRVALDAPAVVNALWEDRVRLDAMVGMETPHTWMQRWKATLLIEVPRGSIDLPSTTAFVGAYGDFVLYGDRQVYISWYPECRLSISTSAPPEEVRAMVAGIDQEDLRRRALAGMAGLMPGLAALEAQAGATRIGGGFIMAVGESDIDDRESQLHERHQIGVDRAGRWVSVSTGKLCTAPGFGIEAAGAVHESLVA